MSAPIVRDFSRIGDAVAIPNLIDVQQVSYSRFLQENTAPTQRKDQGLESLFREIFPIESYDKTMQLEYVLYEMEKPRYTPQECRQLRLTYGYPIKITCRLRKKTGEDMAEQSIYLGEMPKMIGGGEFIINGAERVIVNQLHRSPGVDFLVESKEGDRVLHGGRIIPERGSWIEISVTKKDVLVVRIDQSSKIPATTFLRAMDGKYGTTESIIRLFYPTKSVAAAKLDPNMWAVGTIVNTETGEVLVEAGTMIGDRVGTIQQSSIGTVEVIEKVTDALVLNTIAEDDCESHEQALLKLYTRLRPGNPPQIDKARTLFHEKFYDINRYRLGRVGRFRLNRKFKLNIDENEMTLRPEDFLKTVEYIVGMRNGEGVIDDIDHLGNRRLRTIDELAADEVRKGLLKLRRTVQERMSMKDPEALLRIADLVNSKSVSSSIEYFFGRGELSQVVDQTNALSMLTHERRLSALGPGGLNRKRAGFEVRDVHISHYGRICPIETPEGTNIGLIASLSIFSAIDDYGFLITPYRVVKDGKVVTSGAKTQRNKSEVKSDKEAESTITKWMQDKLECVALPLDIPDKEVSELANKMKSLLTTKRDKDSDVNTVLGFLEDRLMLEFPDETNPKGGIAPYFNRDLPKDSPDRIIMVWKESVPAQLVEWIKNALALVKSRSCEWTTGFENVKKVPGVYLFRQASKSSKIVYVGIAGDSLYTRLGQHWGKTNVEGSGLRWHIWQDKIEGGPDVVYLRADEEMEVVFAPPSAIDIKNKQKVTAGTVLARKKGDLAQVNSDEIDYIDISPKQVVGVSAALIPFLEHDDANRALMGSNMQRQAVPLLTTEAPLVGTGMEGPVAQNSSMVVLARKSGTITAIDATHIVIDDTDEYELEKFIGLNERTCLNQRPIVKLGEKVKKGQIIADGGGTDEGELALGKNILVAFVPFDGYNFEDAILISEKLVRNDVFTSIHIDEFSVEVRETKLGREEFTRDIPNVSEKALRNLDESGVVCEGTRVAPGDILVGKVSPKSKTELTPEEKLLHAIFGRAGEDVKNDSLEVPSGYEGVVIQTKRFIRRGAGSEDQQKAQKAEIKKYEAEMKAKECKVFKQMIEAIHEKLEVTLIDPSTRQKVGASEDLDVIYEQIENFSVNWVKPANMRDDVQKVIDKYWPKIGEIQEERKRKMDRLKHGDELPSGVLEMVKVYVATKRAMSIGDKMAGRHGNKGVIARIMPEEDMPFLEDGTSVEILLNPLGVPSRMNVGQILETHLGWVAKVLGFNAVTPVFDGADEEQIQKLMIEANEHAVKREKELAAKKEVPPADEVFAKVLPSLKTKIYDGRTGEPFEQTATIGYIYMMKLHHLVDDKIHARATGPYSLITQQPLGGKARTGGQRFGEMEVWALEGYGAAYTLQELLTVKSDDIEGRTKIYESMVKGENTLEAGTPISFDVLCNEIRGLGLNIQLEKKRLGNASL